MEARKVVLITGCSSGLGRALCEALPREQYYIVATARKEETLECLSVDLKMALDVCDLEGRKQVVEKVCRQTGRIDVLINNAGYSVRAAMEELSLEELRKMYEVNVYGCIGMMQAVLPQMRRQGSGRILNIGSISGRMTGIVNGGYCASKHAVEAITEATRYEVSNKGIEVCVIEPGAMETEFFVTLANNSRQQMDNVDSPYRKEYLRDQAFRKRQSRENVSACAKKIVEILGKKKLQMRYTVGVSWIYKLLIRLPDSWQEFCVQKFS